MAQNLFAMPGAVRGAASGSKALVEFRAGKMNYNEPTRKVTPDKRKGLIQLAQSADQLIHFIWKDRTANTNEHDLIIFPEDAVFKHVRQCTTGRVYLLEFKSSSRKHFFWMQEPSDAKDEENANKINQFINNPPAEGSETQGGGTEQSALLQMFSQRGQGSQPSRPAAASSSAPSSSAPPSSAASSSGTAPVVGMNDLQSILSQIGMPSSAISGMLGRQGAQPAPAQRPPAARAPRLSTILNAETVRPLLNNPAIQDRLLPFLPHERRTPEELRDIFNSPQFQQSLDSFGEALESGQLGELVRQFGLQSSGPTSIQQFLQAVQNAAENPQENQGENKDKKDDDTMDTK